MRPVPVSQIQLTDIGMAFATNPSSISLFSHLNLTLEQGQSYAITGPSGSGKSSLLMLMSGLEKASTGSCYYVDENGQHDIAFASQKIGFVFQQFHLLPELTALSNVALPLKLRGIKRANNLAEEWLQRVGLGQRLHHKPNALSGGEQQRVAIARALIFNPRFIFADEPTGSLDNTTADKVANLLFSICHEQNAGLVMVTHSEKLAAKANRVMQLENGIMKVKYS